jgi:hypothetical protein
MVPVNNLRTPIWNIEKKEQEQIRNKPTYFISSYKKQLINIVTAHYFISKVTSMEKLVVRRMNLSFFKVTFLKSMDPVTPLVISWLILLSPTTYSSQIQHFVTPQGIFQHGMAINKANIIIIK